ncbi:hypothetical protein ACH0CG_05760 [Microbacterium sp. 179-I 1D1 NHS]|uniref:hypothetical protein n=1 Tax=Microbacterium sp. 179-I 1D1 NHS TaxID=3374298 RepID=UPI0038794BB4
MSFIDERDAIERAAILTGEITAADVDRLVEGAYRTIIIDGGTLRAGTSLRWTQEVPTLRALEIRGRVDTPALSSVEGSSIRTLVVATNRARSVPTSDLQSFEVINSEDFRFAENGWTDLPRLEKLVLGRVDSDVVSAGDGCPRLTSLKLQGMHQTVALDWVDPPSELEWLLMIWMRCRDLSALNRCRALRSLHIDNSSVLVGGDVVDVSHLADLSQLESIGIAENLPLVGVPSLVEGEPPFTHLPVAKGLHDGDPAHSRVREFRFRTKRERPGRKRSPKPGSGWPF